MQFHPDPRSALDTSRQSPAALIAWVMARAQRPVVTTNFRPHSAVLLHLVTRARADIPVIWIDSGYNTPATYHFAEQLTRLLKLNLQVYTPRITTARRSALLGDIPALDAAEHAAFTHQVKLEPFERAFAEWAPDFWFTGIRAEQNNFRRSLGVFSNGPVGSTKVAPLHGWTEVDLENYLRAEQLPDNQNYLDPTKGAAHQECGLQYLGNEARALRQS